jgi:protein-L-isoaspartate(D-aspartate) O-methyltransferase
MTDDDDETSRAHLTLLLTIASEVAETESWTGRAALADRVIQAVAKVPRHAFVPERDRASAYDNRPLGIGHGQTISQPFIVAVMTDLLDLGPADRVLEIGTGCGYQTAMLAELAAQVFSLEVVPELARAARDRLARLGYGNVDVRTGDGFRGLPEAAPFDAVIVTAAPVGFPPALAEQLAVGGRLVIPVGPRGETQMLYRCVRQPDGTLLKERKLPVAFVPMVEGSEGSGR